MSFARSIILEDLTSRAQKETARLEELRAAEEKEDQEKKFQDLAPARVRLVDSIGEIAEAQLSYTPVNDGARFAIRTVKGTAVRNKWGLKIYIDPYVETYNNFTGFTTDKTDVGYGRDHGCVIRKLELILAVKRVVQLDAAPRWRRYLRLSGEYPVLVLGNTIHKIKRLKRRIVFV